VRDWANSSGSNVVTKAKGPERLAAGEMAKGDPKRSQCGCDEDLPSDTEGRKGNQTGGPILKQS